MLFHNFFVYHTAHHTFFAFTNFQKKWRKMSHQLKFTSNDSILTATSHTRLFSINHNITTHTTATHHNRSKWQTEFMLCKETTRIQKGDLDAWNATYSTALDCIFVLIFMLKYTIKVYGKYCRFCWLCFRCFCFVCLFAGCCFLSGFYFSFFVVACLNPPNALIRHGRL